MGSAPKAQKLIDWKDFFPHVTEIGNQLVDELKFWVKSPILLAPNINDVSRLQIYLRPVLRRVLETVDSDDPIRMPDGALEHPFCEQLQCLYKLFCELLNKTNLFFRRTDHHLSVTDNGESIFEDVDTDYLRLLRALNDISEIYYGAREKFGVMLEIRKETLRVLIMTHAKADDIKIEYVSWLLEYKEILGFECRRTLAMMTLSISAEVADEAVAYEMMIDRTKLFCDSFGYITQADPQSLCAGLFIQFVNEDATGPGVMREWFLLVCKEIFTINNALFISNPNDHRRFYINPASKVEPKHHEYFRFCGRVIALALMYKVQIGIVFDRVLFMQLAGLDIELEHIKDTDPTLYRSCKQLLDMDADLVDSDILGLTFVTEYEEFGSRQVVELLPDGESLKVNSRNRADYVDALISSHFLESTCSQVEHFAKGFEDIMICPENMSFFFDCLKLEDLDQMLRGSESDLSVEDWMSHTDCVGYTDADPQIIWFWKIVDEMSPDQRRHLLFFWTSVKYLSFKGFSGLSSHLGIIKASVTIDHLPSSHTCYNQIHLPEYPTYEMMQQRLAIITQEHVASSFGHN